ncbi:MAG TPA: SIS domain-containing protein [Bacillota bacterium]|nr:SIS domain-containing protein [Bacillota bacterium]
MITEIPLPKNLLQLVGKNIFVFGNGGSAALASFFADGLREELAFSPNSRAKIFDITTFAGNITRSIGQGCYQGAAFTQIIQSLGVTSGDMLIGISSSGNSENIVHPFVTLKETIRIGIVGFDDGGVIGRTNIKDLAVIVPDAGGFRSYQRAEDGQRIAISSILSTF